MERHSVYHMSPDEWAGFKQKLQGREDYELGEREDVVLEKKTGIVVGNVRYGTMVIELDTTHKGLECCLTTSVAKAWDGRPLIRTDIFGTKWSSA